MVNFIYVGATIKYHYLFFDHKVLEQRDEVSKCVFLIEKKQYFFRHDALVLESHIIFIIDVKRSLPLYQQDHLS